MFMVHSFDKIKIGKELKKIIIKKNVKVFLLNSINII